MKNLCIKMVDYINIHIYVDGACRNNPGESAIGIVFLDDKGNFIAEHKECVGIGTNNEAEYKAIIRALELAAKYCRKIISIFSDSKLTINQLSGTWAIKKDHLMKLFILVKDRESPYEKVTYNYKKRDSKYLQKADKLANEALDGEYNSS